MKFTTKEIVSMFLALCGVALILTMLTPEPKTPEMIQAEAALEEARAAAETAEAERLQAEADAEFARLEKEREEAHRRRLEEEAQKTPEQKAIEAQNEEMSIGEGAAAVAGIGAAAYIFGKMLDSI